MKTKSLLWICILLLASVFSATGCKSPALTTASDDPSILSGSVAAFSPDGIHSLDSSGITVSIEGTTLKTQSDQSGNFTISGVPAGVYNILFYKAGFDTMIYPEHHLLGDGTDIISDAYIIKGKTDSLVIDSIVQVGRASYDSVRFFTKSDSIRVAHILINGSDTTTTYTDSTITTMIPDTLHVLANLTVNIVAHLIGSDTATPTVWFYAEKDSLPFFRPAYNNDPQEGQQCAEGSPDASGKLSFQNVSVLDIGADRQIEIHPGDIIYFEGRIRYTPSISRGNHPQYYRYLLSPTLTAGTTYKLIVH
jgi:hypothetical protein